MEAAFRRHAVSGQSGQAFVEGPICLASLFLATTKFTCEINTDIRDEAKV